MVTSIPGTDILDEIVFRLVKGLDAESIYLFGSQAEGRSVTGSDYDILVVLPQSDLPRHRREAYTYDLLGGFTVPVDVIVLKQDEFQRQAQVKTSIAARASTKGRLLYAKPEA